MDVVVNNFLSSIRDGCVKTSELSCFLSSLEFLGVEKEVLDVITGQVNSRLFVIVKVRYRVDDFTVVVSLSFVDGIGLSYGEGKIVYNDVDDSTIVIEFSTCDDG